MAGGGSPSNSEARIQGDAIGRGRWESSLLEHPGAKFFEKNRFLTEKEKKRPRTRTEEGDISIEVSKGTFLLSFDKCFLSHLSLTSKLCSPRLSAQPRSATYVPSSKRRFQ